MRVYHYGFFFYVSNFILQLTKKIRAMFFQKEDPVELDLIAAEIKEGRAYLHPRNEENTTYLVRSNDIEISLSKGKTLEAKDVIKMKTPEKKNNKGETRGATEHTRHAKLNEKPGKKEDTVSADNEELAKYRKRKFVVTLYEDEYETVISQMKSYGYRRADFVMACVNTATNGTMEKAHKKIVKSHNEKKREQQLISKYKLKK